MRRTAGVIRLGFEVAVAFGLLVVIELGLRHGGLPATCRRLRVELDLAGPTGTGPDPARPAPPLPRWSRTRVRAALLATAAWPAGDTCLRRCLVLGHRLRRLDPVLRIGVRRDEAGTFRAHSWLEIDGCPLDADAAGFTALGRPGR